MAGVSGGGGAGVGCGLARLVSMSQSDRARSGEARVDVPIRLGEAIASALIFLPEAPCFVLFGQL